MFKRILEKTGEQIAEKPFGQVYDIPIQKNKSHYFYMSRGYLQMDLMFYKKYGDMTNIGYIIVVVDMMKPYLVDARVIANKLPETIIKALDEIIGGDYIKEAHTIYSDDGGEFNNKKVKEWCKTNNVSLRITVAGRKRQNAIVEWMNGVLRQLLMGFTNYTNLRDNKNNKNMWQTRLKTFIKELNNYFGETMKTPTMDDAIKFVNITPTQQKNMLNIGDIVLIPKSKNSDGKFEFRKGDIRRGSERYRIEEIYFNPQWDQERYLCVPENEDENYNKKYNNVTYQRSELQKV